MVLQTCSVSFSIKVCRYFFSKWRINVFLKLKGCNNPPHPLTLTAYSTPGKVVPPIFFMKMTAKDVKEITYMPLVTFFSVLERPEKNVRGLQQPPLVRLGLKQSKRLLTGCRSIFDIQFCNKNHLVEETAILPSRFIPSL